MNWSLRSIFRLTIGASLASTAGVGALGFRYAYDSDRLRAKGLDGVVRIRLASQKAKWIADYVLGQGAVAEAEMKKALPEFQISEISLAPPIAAGSADEAGSASSLTLSEPGTPYRLRIRFSHRDAGPSASVFFGLLLALAAGFSILVSAVGIVFYRRFRRAMQALDANLAASDASSTAIAPSDLGEFRELVDRALALRDRARDAEKDRALAFVAKQVAHDIRSPLSAIQLATKGLGERDLKRGQLISEACKRLNGIAESLLDQARGEIERNGSSPASAAAVPIIRAIFAEKTAEIEAKKLALSLELRSELAESDGVLADGIELGRVLSNLINNSAEAAKVVNRIEVKARRLPSAEVEISVTDDCGGMPDFVLQRAGAERVTFGKANGNGLGLLSAQRLVSKWPGAEMRICSQPEVGTTVLIRLRAASTVDSAESIEHGNFDGQEASAVTRAENRAERGIPNKSSRAATETNAWKKRETSQPSRSF